ncbi:MAG: hypothetical protein DRQ98_12750 [Gammaproteobacteria bacterium]|nr:MAG: hypothetical protein DRQ98_12750 [Gammaproteobacteria bacterium]
MKVAFSTTQFGGRCLLTALFFSLVVALTSMTASAAMVMKMGLGDLVGNADKVFRGTVLTKEPGMVSMGGSEFSTVVYTVSVDDALKGDFGPKPVVTLTMLGNLKQDVSTGNAKRLSVIDMNPDLAVGSDYVLFTTAASSAGLSTTVGLGQGLFRVFDGADGRDMTANMLNNHGIFDGPVKYSELTSAVSALVNP